MRDAGPGGRFLGDGDHAGRRAVGDLVHAPQEVDGVEVLVAAVAVRHPFAGLARVVEVEHRRDGVDAQAVEAVALEPEAGVGDEEGRDLLAAVVVDVGAPVLVIALARVGVLVKMRAVEKPEPVRVVREMARHPVEDEADAGLVRGLDEASRTPPGVPKRLVGANSDTGW